MLVLTFGAMILLEYLAYGKRTVHFHCWAETIFSIGLPVGCVEQ